MDQPTTTSFGVDGMTCSHCVQSVTEELSAVPGVKDVTVELRTGETSTVTVLHDQPISDEQIGAAVEEAGYTLAPEA